jgi:hypothetical protein
VRRCQHLRQPLAVRSTGRSRSVSPDAAEDVALCAAQRLTSCLRLRCPGCAERPPLCVVGWAESTIPVRALSSGALPGRRDSSDEALSNRQPDRACAGEKDAQQLAVIRRLTGTSTCLCVEGVATC